MNILGIETSTLTGSVALMIDHEIRGEITLSVSARHSERLMPMIDQLLRDCDLSPSEIDLYAVSTGPGSFTGLRIGIAAAQGLSAATGKPLIGVSSLQALALNGCFFSGLVVPVIDAFRGEIYRGLYEKNCSLEEDAVKSPENLANELKEKNEKVLLLGNGVSVCRQALEKVLSHDWIELAPPHLTSPRASNVAILAQEHFQSGVTKEPVMPHYLRVPG